MTLTQGQQEAVNKCFAFLNDPKAKLFALFGAGGTGKTFVLSHIKSCLPNFAAGIKLATGIDVVTQMRFTATTNKAARVLGDYLDEPVGTIYSFLGITLSPGENGDYRLNFKRARVFYEHAIVVIDEATFLTQHMLDNVLKLMPNCKIILVGDPYQLLAVKGTRLDLKAIGQEWGAELTEIKRCTPALTQFYMDLREGVIQEQDVEIITAPPSILIADGPEFEDWVQELFIRNTWNPDKARILTYTNAQANAYNAYIRQALGKAPTVQSGDLVIVNSYCKGLTTDSEIILGEEQTRIRSYGITLRVFSSEAVEQGFILVPADFEEYRHAMKIAANDKDWSTYFFLKEQVCDVRDPYSMTIHKSQGSTYQFSLTDLGNLGQCRARDTQRRLKYVGGSRASEMFIGCL